eukprot:5631765-Alexandrium_andersonii.AAC.1
MGLPAPPPQVRDRRGQERSGGAHLALSDARGPGTFGPWILLERLGRTLRSASSNMALGHRIC